MAGSTQSIINMTELYNQLSLLIYTNFDLILLGLIIGLVYVFFKSFEEINNKIDSHQNAYEDELFDMQDNIVDVQITQRDLKGHVNKICEKHNRLVLDSEKRIKLLEKDTESHTDILAELVNKYDWKKEI